MPQEWVTLIYKTARQVSEDKVLLDSLKATLRNAMESHNVKSWDAGCFRATIAADSTSSTFNLTKFKKDHPDLAAQYTEEKVKKGGFTIKLRDNVTD